MPRLLRRTSLALLIAVIAAGTGCRKSPPPTVKLTIDYPGAHPEIVEDTIGDPLLQQIYGLEGFSAMVCVSSYGRAEIYVHGQPGVDAAVFAQLVDRRAQLAVPMLPDVAKKIDKAQDITGAPFPPVVDIRDVDVFQFDLDRTKTAKLGISVASVMESLNKSIKPGEAVGKSAAEATNRLKELTITSSDGKSHSFAEFAKAKVVREPDHRVKYWPPENT